MTSIISLKNIKKEYQLGETTVRALRGVDLEIENGKYYSIIGPSGSGKTTLALAVMRLISSEGPVVFLGKNVQGLRNKQLRPLRRDMQMVFQDPYASLNPRMKIR